jgi:hypothetical protein
MSHKGNYIEELTARVEEGKRAGFTAVELQKRVTVASLKSLRSNGYGEYIIRNNYKFTSNFGKLPPLQEGVNTNILEIYNNLDRV